MWRFFSALCIMSIVAFLGLQRGEAGSLPERPQWRSPSDGGSAQLSSARFVDAGPVSSIRPAPPPTAWTPPAEIARTSLAVAGRSAHALVWLPPTEIASAGSLADAILLVVRPAGIAAPRPHPSIWTPPAEIAHTAPVVEGRSAAGERAPVWLPPAEIASAALDAVVIPLDRPERPSPATSWAPPAEIAPRVSALGRAAKVGEVTLVWLPPREITCCVGRADRV